MREVNRMPGPMSNPAPGMSGKGRASHYPRPPRPAPAAAPNGESDEAPLTVLFMPESAYGPTNNCIGIGAELIRMGHRVVFAAEESWAGKIEPLGIEERLVSMAPPPEEEAAAGQFWIDFIRETAPEFSKPTFEQITTFIEPVWRSLMDGAKYANPQFAAIVEDVQPDIITTAKGLTSAYAPAPP